VETEAPSVETSPSPWLRWLLVLLPAWLVVSGALALWIWWRGEQAAKEAELVKFTTPITAERVADDLEKLASWVGPRGLASEAERRGLDRAAAMIEGALGPSNAGYRVERWPGPDTGVGEWPVLVATLRGDEREPLWLVAGYDTEPGRVVARNSSGLAAMLGVAQALAGQSPGRPVKFAFLPHVHGDAAPVAETVTRFLERKQAAWRMLAVEAIGPGGVLVVSSRGTEWLDDPAIEARARIVGAEQVCLQEDVDLASVLFEMGAPALRVASVGPIGEGDLEPLPGELESAVKQLAGLVRELAARP